MSGADNTMTEVQIMCCASCGKSELDDVKIMECADCKSVRYCSDECQEDHRPEHDAKCKERLAELRDEILFRQPEATHDGDCPICRVPLPIECEKSKLYSCCSKVICEGCEFANEVRLEREKLQHNCPFCRHSLPKSEEEAIKIMMKRIAANDPDALCKMGSGHYYEGDYDGALKYLGKAAELGDASAHFNLSILYSEGHGVEKDEKKEVYHLEEAAIRGHPRARHNLANHEHRNGEIDRAVKHWIISANLGLDQSIKTLKEYYKDGLVSKEDFAAALRGHHAAIVATKSPQREMAAAWAKPM